MGAMSVWHWAILALVVLVMFGGRGKLSAIMGDAAKGIKAFKEGLKDDDKKSGSTEGVSSLPLTDAEKDEIKR
jgi:sec-independent protein translocase protein TatA